MNVDRKGYFDRFGGRYVAEILYQPLEELEQAFTEAMGDPAFTEELRRAQHQYVGRPTPLMKAENVSRLLDTEIYIKLEGYAHTGAHKINNALGQVLLAKRMGKTRVIAETGAGQHGIATAAACAHLGMRCVVYMGSVDADRQQPNVAGMELYGAEVVRVESGSKTLKDAVNEALRDWAGSFGDTHYVLGSALGPSPYPDIVRTFQSVIGRETREQTAELGFTPDTLIACVGGGSNAIGFFSPFLEDETVRLVGVEAGGRGTGAGEHAVRMSLEGSSDAIIQGYKSRFLVDEDGQVLNTHSISAGLDYPGIGPQLAALGERGRIAFTRAGDREALDALKFFAEHEGVLFALESAHAAAVTIRLAQQKRLKGRTVINMSGRGEKDLFITSAALRREEWRSFLLDELKRLEETDA